VPVHKEDVHRAADELRVLVDHDDLHRARVLSERLGRGKIEIRCSSLTIDVRRDEHLRADHARGHEPVQAVGGLGVPVLVVGGVLHQGIADHADLHAAFDLPRALARLADGGEHDGCHHTGAVEDGADDREDERGDHEALAAARERRLHQCDDCQNDRDEPHQRDDETQHRAHERADGEAHAARSGLRGRIERLPRRRLELGHAELREIDPEVYQIDSRNERRVGSSNQHPQVALGVLNAQKRALGLGGKLG